MIGCLLAALFGDKLGRKRTLWVGAAISSIGAILQFSSTEFVQLMIGRTINGFGNGELTDQFTKTFADVALGMTSATCGVFQAETVRGSRRGKLSVIVVLHNVVFYMIASWLTLGTYFMDNSDQWRIPFALQLVPAMVLVTFLFLVPESPRWLLLKDRHEEAIESLRRYLGSGLSCNDEVVQNEYKSICGALEIERQSKISFKEVLLCRDRSSHLKRMLLGMGGQFMQQMGGVSTLTRPKFLSPADQYRSMP